MLGSMVNPRKLLGQQKRMENFGRITTAVGRAATAELLRSKKRLDAINAYAERLRGMAERLLASDRSGESIDLTRREVRRAALVILSSDRGLCGGHNARIIECAQAHLQELRKNVEQTHVEVFGRKGERVLRSKGIQPDVAHMGFSKSPARERVDAEAGRLLDLFLRGEIDRLDMVYTKFRTASNRDAVVETLLPIPMQREEENRAVQPSADIECLPGRDALLAEMLPAAFRTQFFRCFLHSSACEDAARMVAMNGAKENAKKRVKKISAQYRRARQGRITTDLQDLIGGADAVSE